MLGCLLFVYLFDFVSCFFCLFAVCLLPCSLSICLPVSVCFRLSLSLCLSVFSVPLCVYVRLFVSLSVCLRLTCAFLLTCLLARSCVCVFVCSFGCGCGTDHSERVRRRTTAGTPMQFWLASLAPATNGNLAVLGPA